VTVAGGGQFWFDLHLFETRTPVLPYFVECFRQLTREGLGPGRGRAELEGIDVLGASGDPVPSARLEEATRLVLSLRPEPSPVTNVKVKFLTPTELKAGGALAEKPEFGVLMARIRDRLSTLRALYGPGPLSMDFRGFGERAESVKLVRSEIRRAQVSRRSSRTGQVHPLGGFLGEADYEGDLAEFLPFLRAARWTGVGRQTVWGKGAIAIEVPSPAG
jgi:hypothetical protein